MSILVIAEHDNSSLNVATLNSVTAAQAIGGDIDLLVAGDGCQGAAELASKVAGVGKVKFRMIICGKLPFDFSRTVYFQQPSLSATGHQCVVVVESKYVLHRSCRVLSSPFLGYRKSPDFGSSLIDLQDGSFSPELY